MSAFLQDKHPPCANMCSCWQAALLGRDLRQHNEFAVAPGGVHAVMLATEARDDSPRTIRCPRPPACV